MSKVQLLKILHSLSDAIGRILLHPGLCVPSGVSLFLCLFPSGDSLQWPLHMIYYSAVFLLVFLPGIPKCRTAALW